MAKKSKPKPLSMKAKGIEDAYKAYAEYCIDDMQRLMKDIWKKQNRLGTAESTVLYNNISYEIDKKGVTFLFPDYAQWFVDGRKNVFGIIPQKINYNIPTKEDRESLSEAQKDYLNKRKPPISAIKDWISRKGINGNAYGIAYNISYRGIPAAIDETGESIVSIPISNQNLELLEDYIFQYANIVVDASLTTLMQKNIPGVKVIV